MTCTLLVHFKLVSVGIQGNFALGHQELDQRHKLYKRRLSPLQQQYFFAHSDCKVHRGFYYAFNDIKKQVLDSVAEYQKKYGY